MIDLGYFKECEMDLFQGFLGSHDSHAVVLILSKGQVGDNEFSAINH